MDIIGDSFNVFDFKIDCHLFAITSYQFYHIKFYVIIGFLKGGPGGATFAINGTGGLGKVGSGSGLPSVSSSLFMCLEDFDFLIGFLSIPGSPAAVLER